MGSFNSIQPVPADYHAGSTGKWLFTIWAGGFALVVLPYAFYRLRKYRDSVPLLVWIGGFICSLGEPMLDHIGHLWWPQNLPGPVFKGYDLSVPLLIPPCYAFFVSGMGYVAYRQFLKGVTVRTYTSTTGTSRSTCSTSRCTGRGSTAPASWPSGSSSIWSCRGCRARARHCCCW
jgi:hypothetical protein